MWRHTSHSIRYSSAVCVRWRFKFALNLLSIYLYVEQWNTFKQTCSSSIYVCKYIYIYKNGEKLTLGIKEEMNMKTINNNQVDFKFHCSMVEKQVQTANIDIDCILFIFLMFGIVSMLIRQTCIHCWWYHTQFKSQ